MRKAIIIIMLFIIIFTEHTIADIINFDDGGSYLISNNLYQDDTINLDYNISNSQGTSLQLIDDGLVDKINAFDSSTVNVSGGTIGIVNSVNTPPWIDERLASFDNSVITVSGGNLYGVLVAYDNGKIYLYGSDFNVGGIDLNNGDSLRNFGIRQEYFGTSALTGTITGTLLDGTSLDTVFCISEYDIDADVIIAPEPATLLLLGLGGMMLRQKR